MRAYLNCLRLCKSCLKILKMDVARLTPTIIKMQLPLYTNLAHNDWLSVQLVVIIRT